MDPSQKFNSPAGADEQHKAPTVDAARFRLYPKQVLAGRYEILERLGRGEMGEVWHAYDLKLRVDVALKSVRRATPEAVEALRREVRTAREVISPNVCRIFDLMLEEGQEFVCMEYIDGQTLLDLLLERSPLELREVYEIASQLLSGLEAIHQMGLVHRDLKPENIMITRTGRVVVMDFGIAKHLTQVSGTISGTPPYMAPEQLAGGRVDARTDVFSAAVILAEMISTVRDRKSREDVWKGVRKQPPKLPDNPWQIAIARAVAINPEKRFPSASSFARALEELTQRVETIDERKPYPGLSAFTQADADYFFGRELELETALKKLQELQMMAIIGPSGAGKSSFLRAGLVPLLPCGWNCVFTQPGDSPLVNLVQALASEFAGDTEAIRKMMHWQDIDSVVWLLHRWRMKYPQTFLIVDQFEELFTLNHREIQRNFAKLLGRAALDADVRLLLAMRDDFLILCRKHDTLAPIFSDITVLLPLSGEALRRALIQPALRCGYRFEDDALVTEILSDVERERGALPLMAFAAARLWQKRDRQNGILTREAYREIGGVAGALAQHAETTMSRIGTERQAIVREIFRNLITAQKTRAVRDAEELLSIFNGKTAERSSSMRTRRTTEGHAATPSKAEWNRDAAGQVLRTLIDARLLTSFESASLEGHKSRTRVEIIHESLLSAWPRLVRWQTQDADSIQFHDQLRQAAHVWDERRRPEHLLWTGASYKEFEVWKQAYAGGLTSAEQAFADAIVRYARKQRAKRVVLLCTVFVVLLSVVGLIAGFWRSEKLARQEAVLQAQRGEASKLLALGRAELDNDPTVALAYAIASLERADSEIGRRFALRALWKGPPAFVMPNLPLRPRYLNFSPDGKWLAVGGNYGARLIARDPTRTNIVLATGLAAAEVHRSFVPQFSSTGKYVVWTSTEDPRIVHLWSLAKGKEIRTFKLEGATMNFIRGPKLILITDLTGKAATTLQWEQCRIRAWSFDENEPEIIGHWNQKNTTGFDISADAEKLTFAMGGSIYIRAVEGGEHASAKLVGRRKYEVTNVIFHPNGTNIVSADSRGEIHIWDLLKEQNNPFRVIASRGTIRNLFFNSSGSILAAAYEDRTLCLWDMNGLRDADPLILRRSVPPYFPFFAFDTSNQHAVVTYSDSLAFWPLKKMYPYILHGDGDYGAGALAFTPDGKQIAAGFFHGSIRSWQLDDPQAGARDLWRPSSEMYRMDMHPEGGYLAIATNHDGANIISMANGKTRRMPGIGTGAVSFSPDGRWLAAESYGTIRLWQIESDQIRILNGDKSLSKAMRVRFTAGGSLLSGHENGRLYEWNVEKATRRLLAKGNKPLDSIHVANHAPQLIVCLWNDRESVDSQQVTSELRVLNLRTGDSYAITTHGDRLTSIAIDPSGTTLVSGDMDGVVRVGPINGEEPHLLFGHDIVRTVAIHPDRKWIASSESAKPIVRLWQMPKGKPLHTLGYDELLKKLRALTNTRVVEDQKSPSGYRIRFEPFPGWAKAPDW